MNSESVLPSTFYADRDLVTRIKFMVSQWQKAVTVTRDLEEENEELRGLLRRCLDEVKHTVPEDRCLPCQIHEALSPSPTPAQDWKDCGQGSHVPGVGCADCREAAKPSQGEKCST